VIGEIHGDDSIASKRIHNVNHSMEISVKNEVVITVTVIRQLMTTVMITSTTTRSHNDYRNVSG